MSGKKYVLLCVIIFVVIAGIGLAVQLIFEFPGPMPALAVGLALGAAATSLFAALNGKKLNIKKNKIDKK